MKENITNPPAVFPPSIAELSVADLDSEMIGVSEDDPVVAKLLVLRNEYLAHRGTRHVTKGTFEALPNLQRNEIATLIERALSLLTTYRNRLGYTPLLWGHHEAEEFRQLLALIRAGCNPDHWLRCHVSVFLRALLR
jgi:hypothetical protein